MSTSNPSKSADDTVSEKRLDKSVESTPGTAPTLYPTGQVKAANWCASCQAAVPAEMQFCNQCGGSVGPDHFVGKTIDERYEVVRRLGEGAMGAVYEVRHLRLGGKRFAMKVIRAELGRTGEFVTRFDREALSTSKLHHPNCIAVTDYGQAPMNGQSGGEFYLVMEYLEGRSLSTLCHEPMALSKALDIVRQILLGLEHAHAAGVIHRDVKPENVMLVEGPEGGWIVKVLDFGIAKLPGTAGQRVGDKTEVGVVFGTPEYMAPEQALGAEVDGRADLYAVGVILWTLLTGRPVFVADNHVEMIGAKLSQDAPNLGRVAPGVFAPEVEQMVAQALERDPNRRFQTADQFLQVIAGIQQMPGGGLATNRSAITWLIMRWQAVRHTYRQWYIGPNRLRALWRTPIGRKVLLISLVATALVTGMIVMVWPTAMKRSHLATLAVSGHRGGSYSGDKLVVATPNSAESEQPNQSETPTTPLQQVRLLMAKGFCREASLDLKNILRDEPDSAEANYWLGATLICRRQYGDALSAYAKAISLDDEFKQDARILEDLQNLVRQSKYRSRVIDFVKRDLGEDGADILVPLTVESDRKTRQQAIAAVTKLGATEKIDWVKVLALDLGQTSSCRARAEVVKRLVALKDERAIPVLKAALAQREGFFRTRYKHWCIRKELQRALDELQ